MWQPIRPVFSCQWVECSDVGSEEEKMDHPCTAEPAVKTIARPNDEFRSTFEGEKVLPTAGGIVVRREDAERL